ncbi:MAG: recombinase family protein [Oscillospiraceae bacterium]
MSNAMYLRKSRAEESASTEEVLANHKEALVALALRKGISIMDVFEEVVSGESLSARPEMLKLLHGVQIGEYDAVLCMDIDRLGRGGMADQGVILDAFRFSDTLIVTPDKTYDLNNESDEELTEFKAFMARREYKMIRKRMRRGLMQTIEKGGYVANPPYGYAKCTLNKLPTLEIVEEEAKFIRHIYSRYLSGVGAAIISEELNAMGSVPRRNAQWTRNTVRSILSNPTFAGKVAWNRVKHYQPGTHGNDKHHVVYMPQEEWIMVEGLHPEIVSMEDWEKAQSIRKTRQIPSKKTGHTMNPFAGLIVCTVCGHKMQQMGQSSGCDYILCTTKDCQAGCKTEYVEELVISTLGDMLDKIKLSGNSINSSDELSAQLSLLESNNKDIEKLEARIPRLYDFLEDGTYDRDTFRTRMEAIENEKKALLNRQAELITEIESLKSRDMKLTGEKLETVLSLYPTMDPEGKNNLLKTVIAKIDYTKPKKTKPRDLTLSIALRHF